MSYNSKTMACRPPEILGPPHCSKCDFCEREIAEHRVLVWGCMIGCPKDARPLAWAFDLCDACLAAEELDAKQTHEEWLDYWEQYRQAQEDSARSLG